MSLHSPIPPAPAPLATEGIVRSVLRVLFSSPLQAALSLLSLYVAYLLIWGLIDFSLIRAVWSGTSRDACLDETVGHSVGACWPFVQAKLGQFLYGSFPVDGRWRVDLTYGVTLALLVPLLIPSVPWKGVNVALLFGLVPVLAYFLLYGGALVPILQGTVAWLAIAAGAAVLLYDALTSATAGAGAYRRSLAGGGMLIVGLALWLLPAAGWLPSLSLPKVETRLWGGLMVTLVVAITGIAAAMPIGILLALGRRSSLPLIRYCAVGLVEIVRGVPLITVLFFAIYVLPLFLTRSPDGMLRVLIGVSVFTGAYVAETIRGGLQSIPKGQFESAQALGLNPVLTMAFVIMPQVIKRVIPGLVNNFIGLFKDTTLVSIIGIFDLLGGLRASFSDPNWATPVTMYTGFAFAGMIYFFFCYFMSRYSLFLERRLKTEH